MDALFPLNKNVKKKKLGTLVIAILLMWFRGCCRTDSMALTRYSVVNTVMSIVRYLVWLYLC